MKNKIKDLIFIIVLIGIMSGIIPCFIMMIFSKFPITLILTLVVLYIAFIKSIK